MNCPNCGVELEDLAKFCGKCGTPINASHVEEEVFESEMVLSTDVTTEESSTAESSSEGKSLKDEVRFSKGMNSPIEEIPSLKKTGNSLLDSLNEFGAIYHVFMDNSLALLNAASFKENLKKAGKNWYYKHSQDPVIVASRSIDAEIESSQNALNQARKSIADNDRLRREASKARDAQKEEGKKTVEDAQTSGSCLTLVVSAFLVVMIVTYIFVYPPVTILFIVALVAFLLWRKSSRKDKTMRAEFDASATFNAANSQFIQTSKKLEASDAELMSKIVQIESRIAQLKPIAGEIKHNAMERCAFLYATEMLEIDENLQALSSVCFAQYKELKDMGTIPSEDEWFEIDRLTKFVASGRADSLKEALQLLDTANYRETDLAMKERMIQGQQLTNQILDEGFQSLLKQSQNAMKQQRMQYEALSDQMSTQHAQKMAAEAEQIKFQSEILKNQATQNAAAERAAAQAEKQAHYQQQAYNEQADFHQEVKDRFNWNEYNRPNAQTNGDPTVGRKGGR